MRAFLLAGAVALASCGAVWASGYQDFNLGVAAHNRDDQDGAIAALTRALSEPDLPDHLKATALLVRGEAYATKEQYAAAVADYTASLKLRPDDVRTYLDRALSYFHEQQYGQALADDSAAIRLRPFHYPAYFSRMAVAAAMRRNSDELADCDTLVSLWPEAKAAVDIQRSSVYRAMGQYDQAISRANAAIDENPNLAAAYLARGRALALTGELDRSLRDFEETLKLNPASVAATLDRSFVEWDLGKFAEAEEGFRLALKNEQASSFAILGMEISAMKSGSSAHPELPTQAAALDLHSWPGPIVSFYLGKATEGEVRAAVSAGDPAFAENRKCEADFYVSEWNLSHGATSNGIALLKRLVSTCPPDELEWEAAKIELERLPAGTSQP